MDVSAHYLFLTSANLCTPWFKYVMVEDSEKMEEWYGVAIVLLGLDMCWVVVAGSTTVVETGTGVIIGPAEEWIT